MSSFFRSLPSFATDYSGFISLMHGLGGMMIVHDPSGCLGNYTNADELRWYEDPQPVFSSLMRELEAVTGDATILIEKAVREIERRRPPFVCLLGTPIPALTGCDLISAAEEISAAAGVPCFGIETDGFRFYDDGIERALELIFEELMLPDVPKVPGRVNILGMTPLDYPAPGETAWLKQYLEDRGMHIGALIGMGNDLEKVRQARSSELNIVMCAAALPLAQRMKAESGTDYRLGPFCSAETARSLLGNDSGECVLIIGEQLCANALRTAINEIRPRAAISTATFFKFIEECSEPDDRKLHDEANLMELINHGNFDLVIADPLIRSFCKNNQHFIPCAHPALSGKLFLQDAIHYNR